MSRSYGEHVYVLGYENKEVPKFIRKTLDATLKDSLSVDERVALTPETGKYGVYVMALLD